MDVRENHLGIQIGVGDCVAEGGAIRTKRGSERTARLRCDWRSFAQAAKARFESVGIVIGGNRSDAEASTIETRKASFCMLEFLLLTGTLRELAFEGNDKHLLEKSSR